MSKAQKLLQELRPFEKFQDELMEIEEKMRTRDVEVKRQYFENHQIEVDSIRRKQGFYVKVVNKKETAFPDIEKIKFYLEATVELEKNKNTLLTLQKKQYSIQLTNTLNALEETAKEYRAFSEEKKKEITSLNETINGLRYKLQTVENKYKVLGQDKLEVAKDSEIGAKLTGLGVIPFICEKMDILFQQKLPELNFGQLQLTKFKDLRNNILGKFDYTVGLLRRKELEKDRMDEEADIEIKYHLNKMEGFKRDAEQSKKRQKEADQIAQIAKQQLGRQIDFIYKEKKKYEHYPFQIAELKRHQNKLENDKKRLRKNIEDLERKAKKSLGKKVEAMVAAKAAKDAQERLERQAAAFREEQLRAGVRPISIQGVPQVKPAAFVEPKVEMKVEQKVEKEPDILHQKSSKKKKEEMKMEEGEQIIEEVASQKSSKKKKKEQINVQTDSHGQKSEDNVSQKSLKVKKEKIKSQAGSQGQKSEETASQKIIKVKKEKKLNEGNAKFERQDDSVSETSSKSSSRKQKKVQ